MQPDREFSKNAYGKDRGKAGDSKSVLLASMSPPSLAPSYDDIDQWLLADRYRQTVEYVSLCHQQNIQRYAVYNVGASADNPREGLPDTTRQETSQPRAELTPTPCTNNNIQHACAKSEKTKQDDNGKPLLPAHRMRLLEAARAASTHSFRDAAEYLRIGFRMQLNRMDNPNFQFAAYHRKQRENKQAQDLISK